LCSLLYIYNQFETYVYRFYIYIIYKTSVAARVCAKLSCPVPYVFDLQFHFLGLTHSQCYVIMSYNAYAIELISVVSTSNHVYLSNFVVHSI